MLSDTEKDSVLFDWTDTAQKQRWSNFPPAGFSRAGLLWGNIGKAQQNAWLAVMQATLSTEGYDRVNAGWSADDTLATQGGGGGQLLFGKNNYYIALIGTPSETAAWQWQWGGHHVTVNATIAGSNSSLTPSFIGAQPASYTDASGNALRPLGDIEDEAFALVNSLDATQQKAAILANDAAATARIAEISSTQEQTYLAWYGPTTKGSAAYFRVTDPTIVIEYSPQQIGGDAANHILGVYRDPTNDYGAKYAQ